MKSNSDCFFDLLSLGYQEILNRIMKNMGNAFFIKDLASRFMYVNDDQLKRLNKSHPDEVIGKTEYDFFPKELASKSFQDEQQIIKTGVPILNKEEHFESPNATHSWASVSKYPLFDRNNTVIGTWGISFDTTAFRKAEMHAKEEDSKFQLLSDIICEGIIIHENGIIKDVNQTLSAMFGYEPDEAIDKNILDFVCEEDRPLVMESMAEESTRILEIKLIRKSGDVFPAEVSSRTITIFGRKLRMAAIRDITRRKQTEVALKDSETQMRSIMDSAYDAIVMIGPDEKIVYWNPAAERTFGFHKEAAIGKNLESLISPTYYHKKQHVDFMKLFLRGKGSPIGQILDMEAVRQDNEKISVQLSLSTIKMGSGWHAIGIFRDITKQKKSEEDLWQAKAEAEKATNAKSEFLANMSHEIRTPMNAVIGYSDLLKKTELSDKQRDYINKIDTSAKSLLGIINDILDFSKIEAGKLELENVNFRLDEVVNNIINMNSHKASEKNIELINNIASDAPLSLVGDPLRVGQILLNLVNNAVKFTDKGYVLVETKVVHRDGPKCNIQFSVKDTGIGLTVEQKEKLFSAFSQADTSVTRRFGGTGLGLTISKRLVEMMKGEIHVESEFGKGSTFAFTIDFMTRAEDTKKKVISKKNLQNLKVLIVDDNEVSRSILREQIDAFGITAVAVDSGSEAIKEVKFQSTVKPYDLVIMDWRMPEMDGIEAAGTILKDKSIQHMPMAMMVSAFGREEVARKAEKIGINTFLMKPINQSLLFETIVNMFEMDKNDITVQPLHSGDTTPSANHLEGIKILLVEDNQLNQEVATEILSTAGAQVEIANNGKEAIEAVNTIAYDIVLMDLQMPVMGGYEATKHIRANLKNKDLPIIAMTAHAMHGVETECIEAGMNGYVSKPIEPTNLFKTIRKWVKLVNSDSIEQIYSTPDSNNEVNVELPERISGVDLQSGIDRVGGNRKLFKKLLIDFSESCLSYVPEIRKAIVNNDFDDAKRITHTLKGVSGNISANEIYQISSQLEEAIAESAAEIYESLLEELNLSLLVFHEAVNKQCNGSKIYFENAQSPSSALELETLVLKLSSLISENNVDAEKTLNELINKTGANYLEKLKRIAVCIENFDFDAAKAPLKELSEELNIDLDGDHHA